MVEDVVRTLGHVVLGTRMKRIAERLQAEAQTELDILEPQVPAAQHTVLAALDRLGPLSVGEIAEALGIAQPGVTRMIAQLERAGLIASVQSETDQRRRLISLTADGRAHVDTAKATCWPMVDTIVRELCDGLAGPFLDQLSELERRIAERQLARQLRPNRGNRG